MIIRRKTQYDPDGSSHRIHRIARRRCERTTWVGDGRCVVYATAKDQKAEVITGDADLKDLPGVVYIT